jgi:hypothetical protein
MDREGASVERSIDMMIQRLDAKPFVIQLPYGVGTFISLVQTVDFFQIFW